MAEEDKKEEPKKGKWLACVSTREFEDEDMTVKQFDRIFKTDVAAQRHIYDWLKREYMGGRDTRTFLNERDDDEEFYLDALILWLGEHKKLDVEFDVVELDE